MGEIGIGAGEIDSRPKRRMVRDVEVRRAEQERIARERVEAEQKIVVAKRAEKERIRKEAKRVAKIHRSQENKKYDEDIIQNMLEHVEGSVAQKKRLHVEMKEKDGVKKANKKELALRIAEDRERREDKQFRRESEHELQLLKDAGFDVEAMQEARDRGLTFGTKEWDLFMAMRGGETSVVYDSDIPYKEDDLLDRADTDSTQTNEISDVDSDILDPEEARLEQSPKQMGIHRLNQKRDGFTDTHRARKSGVKIPEKDEKGYFSRFGVKMPRKISEDDKEYLRGAEIEDKADILATKNEIKKIDVKIEFIKRRLKEDQEKTGGMFARDLQEAYDIWRKERLKMETKLARLNLSLRGKKWQ